MEDTHVMILNDILEQPESLGYFVVDTGTSVGFYLIAADQVEVVNTLVQVYRLNKLVFMTENKYPWVYIERDLVHFLPSKEYSLDRYQRQLEFKQKAQEVAKAFQTIDERLGYDEAGGYR
jgi:hypothetical protein